MVAFVTFYRGQTKAFETAPVPITDGLDPKTKALPIRFNIGLDKLPVGRVQMSGHRARSREPESRVLAGAGHAGPVVALAGWWHRLQPVSSSPQQLIQERRRIIQRFLSLIQLRRPGVPHMEHLRPDIEPHLHSRGAGIGCEAR